jgi:hypothetical protein
VTFKTGDGLYLVGQKGEISEVKAKSDEFRGRIEIEGADGKDIGETSIIHLCRTMRAAVIIANNRKG